MDITTLATNSVIAGTATTLATEVLKSKYIPVPAEKYPRATAAVVSLGVSGYAIYRYNQSLFVGGLLSVNWHDWIVLAVSTFLVSAFTFNHVVKGL